MNNDGKVEDYVDIQVNSPAHKANLSLRYFKDNLFGTIAARYISTFNFFAGETIASETIPNKFYQGFPIVEGQQVNGTYNEGSLGGFVNIDVNIGYKFLDKFTIIGGVINVTNAEVRDFATSPTIRRMFNVELRVDF